MATYNSYDELYAGLRRSTTSHDRYLGGIRITDV